MAEIRRQSDVMLILSAGCVLGFSQCQNDPNSLIWSQILDRTDDNTTRRDVRSHQDDCVYILGPLADAVTGDARF